MPLYEYQCDSCGKKTEVIQSYREKLKICPHCGSRKMKRAISAPAIQFKGSGWYVTDYGGRGKAEAKSKDEAKSKEKSDAASSSEAKTEGKSETKEKPAESKKESKESKKKSEG